MRVSLHLICRPAAIGARLAPGCVLRHVSAELSSADDWRDEGWGEKLQRLGYRGDRPSLWIMQVRGGLRGGEQRRAEQSKGEESPRRGGESVI